MKILCAVHDFSPEGKAFLAEAGEVDYAEMTQEELVARVGEYDALFVRIGLEVNKEVLEAGVKLKAIATATTGLNHIDLEAARERGIPILSLREESAFLDTITSTAELAFGMMIDLMRYTPWAFDAIKRYEFDLEAFRGRSLYGKTLGIIGLGRLGRIIARGAEGWRMKVQFVDPNVTADEFPEYAKVDLDTLLATSDVVTIHVHLKEDTEGLMNAGMLAKMKKGSCLINTSRGEIVDELAVRDALASGQLGGYATDVLANELQLLKEFCDHPLVEYAQTHDNCIIVPHTGGLTHDSRIGTDVFMAQKLAKHLQSN